MCTLLRTVLFSSVIVVVILRTALADNLFYLGPFDYAVGDEPLRLFSADFDGDNDNDLAVSNISSNSISILLNNGDGTLSDAINYEGLDWPTNVISADLDGDGDNDLAVANQGKYGAGSVSILYNNGDGTFAAPVNYSIPMGGPSFNHICSADFDGDSLIDLAISGENYLIILKNYGSPNYDFVEVATYLLPASCRCVVSVDLDGDNDFDLAVSSCSDLSASAPIDNVCILLNNGDGTFADAVNYDPNGDGAYGLFPADLDGDGDYDLAVTDIVSDNISILMNNGDGTFDVPVIYDVEAWPSSIFSADLDGDGDNDLATANWASHNVSILLNNGDGTFAAAANYDAGICPFSVFAVDLDGQDYNDLIVSNQGSNTVSVFLSNIYICGDINLDDSLNESDLYYSQSYIFEGGPSPLTFAPNIDSCSEFNISDLTYFNEWLSYGGPAPCQSSDCQIAPTTGSLSLDHVEGLSSEGTIEPGVPTTFHIRLSNNSGYDIIGSTNGFRVYSPTGIDWHTTVATFTETVDNTIYDGGQYVNEFSMDALGSDTVGFGGYRVFSAGIPDGFDDIVWTIQIGPVDMLGVSHQICLDTCFYNPTNAWLWSTTGGISHPAWDGPYCFDVTHYICGDVNNDANTDISDLTYLVDYMFGGGQPPYLNSADMDGCSGVNVSDFTYYVQKMFHGGPDPCQSSGCEIAPTTGSISLDHVEGLSSEGTIVPGVPTTFYIRMNNNSGYDIVGSTNGFRVYSPTGADWDTTSAAFTGTVDNTIYDGGQFVNAFSCDASGSDTVGFGGFRMFKAGIPNGFDEIVWTIQIGPVDALFDGQQICLDTCFYYPINEWMWSTTAGMSYPTWDGPHCYTIVNPVDADSDGVYDAVDNCPNTYNPLQEDTDSDDIGNPCDQCTDTDGDTYGNPGFSANTCTVDNCPTVFNPDQMDSNGDDIGDACTYSTSTDAGTDVNITIGTDVSMTFESVTSGGETEMTVTTSGPEEPSSYTTIPVNNPIYYNITTTASFSGDIQVCIDYDDIGLTPEEEAALTLQHYDGMGWTVITTSLDTLNNLICGTTTSLSPFIVTFVSACCDLPGDADHNSATDISDLTYYVDYLFAGGPGPICMEEFDNDGNCSLDISDLTYFVDFMFAGGPPPVACHVCP